MPAYYNEIDPKAAAWLRELIKQGHIAPGEVDERSIEDITPNDLKGFTQFHAFAGIGVWSHALRQAGWPDDQPVWTGSCPCQPFSTAGKGKGTDDERHLWPSFHWLIKQCRPDIVFGEQVAQKAGAVWFDIVSTDLEGEGYSCGKVVFPACSVGAPHLRQRQYWVAYSGSKPSQWGTRGLCEEEEGANREGQQDGGDSVRHSDGCEAGELAYTERDGRQERERPRAGTDSDGKAESGGESDGRCPNTPQPSGIGELADTDDERPQGRSIGRDSADKRASRESGVGGEQPPASPTNNFWRDADWLLCRDGKWRPVEPSTFPLAHGSPARVGRLRGYGNAIVGPQAKAFIEAVCETISDCKAH